MRIAALLNGVKQTASAWPEAANSERGPEVGEREFPARARCAAQFDSRGIEVREVDEDRPRADRTVGEAGAQLDVGRHGGGPGARREDARVADDDDVCRLPHFGQRDRLDRQLRR